MPQKQIVIIIITESEINHAKQTAKTMFIDNSANNRINLTGRTHNS